MPHTVRFRIENTAESPKERNSISHSLFTYVRLPRFEMQRKDFIRESCSQSMTLLPKITAKRSSKEICPDMATYSSKPLILSGICPLPRMAV